MTGATRRLLRAGEQLPPFSLPGPDGPRKVPGAGNQASMLVFVHDRDCAACERYLDEIGAAVTGLGEWATRLLAVAPRGEPSSDRPFPVLVDEGGAVRRRLGIGDDEAAVLLADRWGELFEAATFGTEHDLPLPRQLIESAKILDVSCGECNVVSPEWRQA